MTTDSSENPLGGHPEESLRAYAQLLRQQERASQILEELRDEMEAPTIQGFLRTVARDGSGDAVDAVQQVLARIQDSLRSVQICQSEIHRELSSARGQPELEGPANLPPALARFLAERQGSPSFTYEIRQDEVRGWVILWKEFTERGTVRGGGQFYERPYAWLND